MMSTFLDSQFIQTVVFSIFSITAVLMGSFAFWRQARIEHYDEYQIMDTILWTLFYGLLLGRSFYALLHFDEFGLNPFYWLAILTKPGFHWAGLVLGSIIALIYMAKKHKWNEFVTLDLASMGAGVSHCLLNMGLFFSGASLGRSTDLPLAWLTFDSSQARHPVALYAAVIWLLLSFLLIWLETKYRRFIWYQRYKGDSLPGFVFFVYLSLVGFVGLILTPLSQPTNFVAGLNIDLMLRISLLLFGLISLLARSGWGSKLGLDHLIWLGKR